VKKVLFAAVCAFLFTSTSAFAGEVVLKAFYEDKEQPPYYLGSGEAVPENPGVAVEMVKLLEEYVPGLKVELSRTPWARCLSELEANNADAIFNSSYNTGRLKNGRYPTIDGTPEGAPDTEKRITTIAYYLYKKKSTSTAWDGEKFKSLGPWKLGAPLGYSIVGDLEKLNIPVDKVAGGTPAILKMLAAGRFPGAVLQDVTADSIIASTPEYASALAKDEKAVVSKPYYLMLSHGFVEKHPETAKAIWNAIETIRNERFGELVEKYSKE